MITLTEEQIRTSAARAGRIVPVAAQYYAMAHWLRSPAGAAPEGARIVGITSCSPGAGVSTVAQQLATAAAQAGDQPVLLFDLSRAAVGWSWSAATRMSQLPGGLLPLQEQVEPTAIGNLSQLVVDSRRHDAIGQLNRDDLRDLLSTLESDFSFIVVDLPTANSEFCIATAGLLHGVVLVMEAERTHAQAAAQAREHLVHAQANVLGAILNKRPQHLPGWLASRL